MKSAKSVKIINTLKAIILPIAVYFIMLAATGGRFGGSSSMMMMFRQSVVPIILAFSMGMNMMMGMWDFSAGAVIYASAMLGCTLTQRFDAGLPGLLIFCMLIAVGLTTLTGFLYRMIKIPSMVLGLGLAMVYEGLPRVFQIKSAEINLKHAIIYRAPWCFIILAVLVVLFYVLYNYSPFGYNVRAIGADQKIARQAGVNIEKTKQISFSVSGIFLGLAAPLYLASMMKMYPLASFASVALIFDSFMGIFIALFLTRYCNFTWGIFIGMVTMQMLMFGLMALGLNSTFQKVVQGIFLLAILVFSSNQGALDDRKARKRIMQIADQKYAAGNL